PLPLRCSVPGIVERERRQLCAAGSPRGPGAAPGRPSGRRGVAPCATGCPATSSHFRATRPPGQPFFADRLDSAAILPAETPFQAQALRPGGTERKAGGADSEAARSGPPRPAARVMEMLQQPVTQAARRGRSRRGGAVAANPTPSWGVADLFASAGRDEIPPGRNYCVEVGEPVQGVRP